MQVSVAEAKNKLPELIKAVEEGEQNLKPKFGTGRGKIKVNDADWWKPMTDQEVEAFLEGRY